MAGAAGKKAPDAAAAAAAAAVAAAAAAEAALAAEELEREAAAAALKAQQEAEEEAANKKKEQEDELDIVAVGAVAHVIRRAFHSFYQPASSPSVATARAEAGEDSAALGEADALAQPVEVEAASAARSQQQDGEGGGQDASTEREATSQPSSRMMPQKIEESPFVALGRERKEAIARALAEKHERATALLRFLEARHHEADEADARIAKELSEHGLVVKAQIPVGPSHLRLDEHEIRTAATDTGTDFGEFSESLLYAKALVTEYQKQRNQRSGNAKAAMTSPSRRTAAGEGSSEAGERVGYLDTTASSDIRKESTFEHHQSHIAGVKTGHALQRTANTGSAVCSSIPDDLKPAIEVQGGQGDSIVPPLMATTLAPSSTTEQQQSEVPRMAMTAVEKRKNLVILERMQTKLDFVRNPRFAVPEPTKSSKNQLLEQSADSTDVSERRSSPPPCFVVVPNPPITFTTYDVGGIYEQIVYVRNVGGLSRRARILPPGTLYFSMASVVFPEASGLVAPGMHVELRVRFAPDSRADYKDSFTIQYETEQSVAPGSTGTPGAAGAAELVVPLMAHREPPELTLPLVIHAQNTLVGGRSMTPLVCKNVGGKARFWLLSESAWAQLERLQVVTSGMSAARSTVDMLGSEQSDGTMKVGPFRLTPNEMELDKGESVTFELTYTPSGVGEQRERFVMVCDNCLVRVFQLVGRGCQVELAARRVNETVIDASIAEMGPLDRIFFPDELLVNARAQQTIVVANDTPLDVKFTWKIQALPCKTRANNDGENEDQALSVPSGWVPPFRVLPESGVFALSSSIEFTIEFLPVEARTFAYEATLMANDIPACSMPGPDQIARLKAAFQTRGASLSSPQTAAMNLQDAMPGFSMQLHGRARLGSFAVMPARCDSWHPVEDGGAQLPEAAGGEAEQLLQRGQRYTSSVVLNNQVDARVAFHWDLGRLRQRHLAADGGPSASTLLSTTPASFELTLSPLTGELDSLGHHKVEITFTPLRTGTFSLSVPCRILSSSSTDNRDAPFFERWLLLEGRVAEAEIEIVEPEVDFGLVLVGASAETVIAIRNPSPCASAHWRFLHLDIPGPSGTQQQFPHPPKLQRTSSKDSISSRHSVMSSASGNETERSLFTSRDILPRATVVFAPESGVLAPGEALSVKATCLAGALPERFRGLFSCQVGQEQRFSGARTAGACAVVAARAEIQSPNIFLTTTKLPLGTTYVGVEVRRTVELVNVSNLEAAFKFVEPEGVSKAYSVTFSPQTGTIHSKERLVVTLGYTPRQIGRFAVIFACSVRGLTAPLGFEVISNHKGLVLSYELLPDPCADPTAVVLPKSPKEIAMERGILLSDCDLEPEINPLSSVPKLAFGEDVPLGARRTLSLLVRNFSGIEALVDLQAKKYPAVAVSAEHLATATSTTSSTGTASHLRRSNSLFSKSSSPTSLTSKKSKRTQSSLGKSSKALDSARPSSSRALSKPRLTDADDDAHRLQSENGRAYLRERAEELEDRQVLRGGRGVAFQLKPERVHIPPWEQVVVRVTCFNNMSGVYLDDIVSRAAGAPPVFLHASVGVVGTPLAFDHNCVGLHFGKPVPVGRPQALLRQPTLSFGSVCVRAPSITRTLRVVNRGPQPARIKWKLVENGCEDQLVKVTLRVDFSARLQLRITPCEDDADSGERALPFVVTPDRAMIPAFATVPFQITFEPPKDRVDAPRALLLVDAHWFDSKQEGEQGTEDNAAGGAAVDGSLRIDLRQEDSSSPAKLSNNSLGSRAQVAAGKAFAAVRIANAMLRKPGVLMSTAAASSFSPKCLRVLLAVDVIEPELSIDKPREQLQLQQSPRTDKRPGSRSNGPQTPLSMSPQLTPYHIKFTTWSTLLSAVAAQHIFHRRELFLVNRLGSRLTFRLESSGPFAVAQADSLAPRHPLSLADLPQAHRRSTAQGESYMFMLPPQMAVRIDLRFIPSTSMASASSAFSATTPSFSLTTKPSTPGQQPLHYQIDGELRVKFATRSVQTIRLVAVVLRPAIVASPSVFFFGRVHLSSSRVVVLRLANPTVVTARFAVQHMPRPKPVSRAQHQEMRVHHAHLLDEPGVFTFSALSGELQGPTTSLKSAGGWLPTTDSTRDLLSENASTTHPLVHAPLELQVEFRPRESGRRYKSRFRFAVEHGRDFEVVLEGAGHLDEEDNPRDGDRPLVRVRELQHSNLIFRRG
ncbi:hypothetical protein BBJ28_00005494 [Nothophytophthora sp. Chile5]|nr:hypothetical protein BBJ28_00005494 [Nothophytophthora sp. Chile5]